MTAFTDLSIKPLDRLGQAARWFTRILAAIEWPRLHAAHPRPYPKRLLSDHLPRDLGLRSDGEGL